MLCRTRKSYSKGEHTLKKIPAFFSFFASLFSPTALIPCLILSLLSLSSQWLFRVSYCDRASDWQSPAVHWRSQGNERSRQQPGEKGHLHAVGALRRLHAAGAPQQSFQEPKKGIWGQKQPMGSSATKCVMLQLAATAWLRSSRNSMYSEHTGVRTTDLQEPPTLNLKSMKSWLQLALLWRTNTWSVQTVPGWGVEASWSSGPWASQMMRI